MSEHAAALQHHLEELVRMHEKLLRLTESRREAMVARDTRQLEALLAEERRLGAAIFQEEQRRRVTMARLGGQVGHPAEETASMPLSEAVALLGEPWRGRLTALGEQLHGLAERIRRANDTALALAQRFLPFFEELLGVLVDGTVGQVSYTSAGQSTRSGSAGMNLLDVRV